MSTMRRSAEATLSFFGASGFRLQAPREVTSGWIDRNPDAADMGPRLRGMTAWVQCNSLAPSRAIRNPANDWLTGMISSRLTLRCTGRLAIQKIVSAISSAVIGCAPV